MAIESDVIKLEPGALIDLYILDLNSIGIGVIHYFYNGTNANYGPVRFQGQDYTPWPISLRGIESRGDGAENRPEVSISNYGGFITNEIKLYEDLVGAVVKRRRTFAQYTGGETVDTSVYSEQIHFIEQKSLETALAVTFILSSAMDFVDKILPGRTAIANSCPWQYKNSTGGSGCGWPGTNSNKWYDKSGNQVFVEADDECGKRLTDCKLRFGQHEPLDFGGFPALGRF